MAPRSIALTEDEDRLIDGLVRSGRFRDADAVVREGLRLVAEEENDDGSLGYTPEDLKAAIQVGLDDLENGRYVEFKNADELRAYFAGRTDDLASGRQRR